MKKELLKTIDQNFNLHACRIPGTTKGMKVNLLPGLTFVDSGLSCDTFNIIHITSASMVSENELLSAVNHFRKKNFAFCIWVSRENLDDKVSGILKRASVGMQNMEPGMVLDLSKYATKQDPLYGNITIAKTEAGVRDFAEVIAVNWNPPDENVRKFFKLSAGHYLNPKHKIQLVLYYEDGRPVSVLEMFGSNHDTLGLYSLATLSTHRGKGIGSALMKFALNIAKSEGYKRVVLQASEDGIGIYRKYGFEIMTNYYEFS
jgi:ribosomal protein S18 acetylase RimI-like enzyme